MNPTLESALDLMIYLFGLCLTLLSYLEWKYLSLAGHKELSDLLAPTLLPRSSLSGKRASPSRAKVLQVRLRQVQQL